MKLEDFHAYETTFFIGKVNTPTSCHPFAVSDRGVKAFTQNKNKQGNSFMSEGQAPSNVLALTAQIVSAHVSHNAVAAAALPALIQDVHRTLSFIEATPAPVSKRPEPAVPIAKSVTPEFIFCLEDGKKMKMLKRHLKTAFNMTPEQYRVRWGLPTDYPMVAPRYAKQRSSLAKKIGLGTKPRKRRGAAA
jgi:predicted transcriptional regulator